MAYRLILGREPESPSVIAHWINTAPDLTHLRNAFLESDEFLQSRVVRLPKNLDLGPPMQVDVDVTPELKVRMTERIGRIWQTFGETEPFWSVFTSDDFILQKFGENAGAYWASGQADVNRLNAWLMRNGIPPFGRGHSCLEYGCGTGRTTAWLAKQFSTVAALDISKSHLQLAREHLTNSGLSNVSFHHVQSLDSLGSVVAPVDVVFSIIVLQHNPPPVIGVLIRKMLKQLKPGGVAFFQVPTYSPAYRFSAQSYFDQPDEMEMHIIPQKDVISIADEEGCSLLEVQPDSCTGLVNWISNTFLFRRKQV